MPTLITPPQEPTPARDADVLLDRLSLRRSDWARTGIPERIELLRRAREGVLAVSEEWVRLSCLAKGIDPGSTLAGEEWLSGPVTTLRALRLTGEALEQQGQPFPPALREGAGGQSIASVMPASPFDRILFRDMRAEVWILPDRPPSQGRIYRELAEGRPGTGLLALVLGAGNISSIAPTDVLHQMFVENRVVALKPNPVNAYLGPLLERAFAGLIEAGFLGVVYGGGETGRELCHDPRVEAIHLTGSERTYDAIVWGADEQERRRRKAAGEPLLTKPFSAELGCVTPVLVVPGRWSEADLEFQATHLAAMLTHNAGFNCTTSRVIVTARGWRQRKAFLEHVERRLAAEPPRRAYYPGASERLQRFVRRYPQARALSPAGADALPWTVIRDVPFAAGEPALAEESFCGMIAETAVDARDAPEFLERAVPQANERIHGTLSCVLLIDPDTAREHAAPVERAIRELRYGAIAVNAWTGVNFGLGVTSWGAFPGHTPERIESGTSVVHNAFLFDHPERSVVYAPFRPFPKPVWFTDHRNLLELGRRMTGFEARPSWSRLPGVILAALRG